MESSIKPNDAQATRPCAAFGEFLQLFAGIRGDKKLFPKVCKTCGKEYADFPQYVCLTKPKGHVFEDCSRVMKRPFTMVYRHCSCGNTLVLTLTEETFPELHRFWSCLVQEACESGRPLVDVVGQFAAECDRHVLALDNPCAIGLDSK